MHRPLLRPWRILLLVVALAALPLLGTPASAASDPADRVRDHLSSVADEQRVPGLAVAHVGADGEARTWTVGEDGAGHPVTGSTPFLLGSVSKSFTAALVLDLVAEGELALDDRLGDVLPDHGIADPRADDITVEQLLTHTAGLSTADGLAHADRFDTRPDALHRQATGLSDVELTHAPGTGYEYSDLGYLLLGAVVEEAGGAPFGEQLRSRVMEPAGVLRPVTDVGSAASVPPGHRQVLGRAMPFDPGYDLSGVPYGYVGADLDGLTAWARANLGGQGLSDETLREAHSGHVATGGEERYGYGWRVSTGGGERIVHHTGATPGYFTHVYLLPDRGEAVVVLANAYGEARAPALAATAPDVLRLLDDETPAGTAADPVLTAAPWVVVGLAVLGLAGAAVASRSRRRGLLLALGAAAALVTGLALLAPGLLGYTSTQLRLWAPDLGWGLWAVAGTWGATALAAAVGLARRSRRGREVA